jgi:ABC-type multidrug transport system fused ATPase/permease subunit
MSGIKIPWLGDTLIVITFIGAIYWIYSLVKERQIARDNIRQNKDDSIPNIKTGKILQIERKEFKYKLPVLLNIGGFSCIFIVLGFGINEIYLWIVGRVIVIFNIWTILILILFVILPIYALVEPLFKEPKYYRLFRNCVAKDAEFITYGNINNEFNNCVEILNHMNAKYLKVKGSKLLKAMLGISHVTIELRRRKNSMVRVYILNYAFGVTESSYGTTIQNNIDIFKNMLYLSHGKHNNEESNEHNDNHK